MSDFDVLKFLLFDFVCVIRGVIRFIFCYEYNYRFIRIKFYFFNMFCEWLFNCVLFFIFLLLIMYLFFIIKYLDYIKCC